jgi:hypothetical protein
MNRLDKIKRLIQYCWKNKKPVLITGIRLSWLRWKTGIGICYLMDINYLFGETRDTYMMHDEYINLVLKVNDLAARQFMNHKENLLKRCPDLVKRDFLVLEEHSKKDILDFIRKHPKFVSKINASACGEGFCVYESDGSDPYEILEKIKIQGADILEEYVYQHTAISEIYPESVNTIRMHTVNNGKEVRCFINPYMRIGANGSVVDVAGEGYKLVLNPDGTVLESVFLKSGLVEKAEYHRDTGKRFSEVKIPFMEEVYELVKKAAVRCPETPYIGWDVAIRQDGPLLIEGNGCSGCFDSYQKISNIYYGCGMKKEILEMLAFARGESNEECLLETE